MRTAIEVATGFLESFTANDPDAIASHVADAFRNEHRSELGSDCIGREEYRRRLPHFLSAFADRRYQIEDLVEHHRESGTDLVVLYRFIAIYDLTPIEIPGVMWLTVHEGLVTRRVDTWDSLTFLRQIGAEVELDGRPLD
ncbi:nuclear transport factor 2 family protein [Ilumatobacter sp.]|uniref:nuclear transport factor 2 family protein n=1 Tax=Ilumatobacter sp. TaxID=1967498 RepID=UPI003B51C0C3